MFKVGDFIQLGLRFERVVEFEPALCGVYKMNVWRL